MVAAGVAVAACDPHVADEGSPSSQVLTEEQANEIVNIVQTDIDGELAADGNYFTYTTSPATIISIFTINDEGTERVLASGTSGYFSIIPSRGSSNEQTFYVRIPNPNGTMTELSKTVNVYVPSEMALDLKLVVSNSGSKVWKWDTTDGKEFWGNMGYCGGAGSDVALNHNGQWWGVSSTEGFADQQNHRGSDTVTGDDDTNAFMIWSEDGTIKSYDANGQLIRTGTFEIQDYDASDASAWKVGTLHTSAGAILWPYEINSNGNMPTEFDLCYLSADKMCLVYPDGGAFDGLGAWGEATFWHFASSSDVEGNLTNYADAGKVWTWDTSDGKEFWGNMGYCGGAGIDVYTSHNGQWWGVTSTEGFADQQNHRGSDTVTGDDDTNAYMIITADEIKSYDASGKQIRSGYYTIDQSVATEWKVANLETTAGSILWPYEINSGGNMPTTFEMVYSDGSHFVLVYPDGGAFDGLGAWGEATFWRFMAK